MIEIIDILKPKNGGSFKLIDAIDVAIEGYTSLADCVSHMATTAMIEAINAALGGKQDKLTTAQLAACNSGITSNLVAQITANTTALTGKASQADLDSTNAALAGKADASDLTTATANLQAQIDLIVTPVTQDAEVQNARVGVDGTSYVSLKARLDNNENTLDDYIDTTDQLLYRDSINKFDPSLQTALTIDPHFYSNGAPYRTTEFDNDYHASGVFPIKPATEYTIGLVPAKNDTVKPWGVATEGIFFYDANMVYISDTPNNTFTTPVNAKFARFNYSLLKGIDLTDLQTKVMLVLGSELPETFTEYSRESLRDTVSGLSAVDATLSNEIAEISDMVIYQSINKFDPSLQTASTIDPHYYFNGEPYRTTEFDSSYHASGVFPIEGSKEYSIGLVPAKSGIIKIWQGATEGIFFYDEEMNYISDTPDITFTTPAAAKYARFNYSITNGVTLTDLQTRVMLVYGDTLPNEFVSYGESNVKLEIEKLNEKVDDNDTPKIKCIVDGDGKGLSVISKYDNTHDIVIELREKGGNDLFDFDKIGLVENTSKQLVDSTANIVYLIDSLADWHSPFIVSAVNNKDGDQPSSQYFTGGNHQYNNNWHGSTPNARCTNLHFYADNMEFTTDVSCSILKICWENYVQAYDTEKADGTGREVLKEIHHLTFDGEKWESRVDLVPLEDVLMKKWMAFLWSGTTSVYTNIRYIGGVSRQYQDCTVSTNSGNATAHQMTSHGTNHALDMWLDSNFDMGDLSFFDSTADNSIYTLGQNKGYFNVIANRTLLANNYYSIIGYYKFYSYLM